VTRPDPPARDRGDYSPPRPPSERGKEPDRSGGVGLFRLAGWGWGLTIALFVIVGSVALVGYLRDDPGRNPAPSAYRTAVCEAFAQLAAGVDALERGVAVRDDPAGRDAARAELEERVDAAGTAVAGLPEWAPGRPLDELIGAQIITLTNGAAALDEGPVEEDLEVARTVDAQAREQLSGGRYGFTCDA